MSLKKYRRKQTIEFIDGINYIVENGEKILHLRNGTIFNGSRIADNGKYATCQTCGARHAVGLKCATCNRSGYPAKRKEHKDIQRPEIRGT